MRAGEFAVHYSSFSSPSPAGPYCTVFSTLDEAVAHAKASVQEQPGLRCRIYDHQGFAGAPLREYSGSRFKGNLDLSPRFRRWVGSTLFFGGIFLTLLDWHSDFKLAWPAMLGTRMLIPGLVLLFIEAAVVLYARHNKANAAE